MKNPTLDAQVSAVLRHAAEKVSAGWCQRIYARDVDGKPVHSALSGLAASWCATGAVSRAAYDLVNAIDQALLDACWERLKHTLRVRGLVGVALWNDAPERQQQEVVEALLRAGRVK